MESNAIDKSVVISNHKTRVKLFCFIYRRSIIILSTLLILLPVLFLGEPNAYCSLYIFLVCAVFWGTDSLHPAVVSLVAITLYTIGGAVGMRIMNVVRLGAPVLDCLGVLLIATALEHSKLHRRVALNILLIVGTSHSRLGFLVLFSTMLMSMVMTDTLTCCLMLPIVRAMLLELERMGISEAYQTTQTTEGTTRVEEPSDLALFYFLGIAFSSTIGGSSALFGNAATQILIREYEAIFPMGPKMEFPDLLLLSLPGCLIMESLLYLWLNMYFIGMLRVRNYTALEAGLTGEEVHYISTLLRTQYKDLGTVTFHEMVVFGVILLTGILGICVRFTKGMGTLKYISGVMYMSAPTLVGALILSVVPANMDFMRFCQRKDFSTPAPAAPSEPCLTWDVISKRLDWSVLIITAGCNIAFEGLIESTMTVEFGKFLMMFADWSIVPLVFLTTVFCKVLTEFASNTTVARGLLYQIAKVVIVKQSDPRSLMSGVTLSITLPFHLKTATPVNTFVLSYANIPPRKMILAGIGPSVVAVLTVLFTVCIWTKAIWPVNYIPSNWTDPFP